MTGSDGVLLTCRASIPERGVRLRIDYTFQEGAAVRAAVALSFQDGASPAELPRLGMQFEVPAAFERVTWFGRGPHENYWDRKTSAWLGRHEATVSRWTTDYVRPQENANRCDIRWLSLADGDGRGLQVAAPAGKPLSMSAWPYTMEDLAEAKHDFELPRRERITVNLDHLQMGVGGDNSWGLPVNEPYRIKAKGLYEWSFTLSPARR